MTRWRVERGFWWVAMLLDKQGREITRTAKRFTTHAEAIAYADRMARTVEVVLPRGHARAGRFILQRNSHHNQLEVRSRKSPQNLNIVDDEINPLAVALLAHHYKPRAD